MKKKNAGFSLVEILIALAILGLIASIVYPVMTANKNKASYQVSVFNLTQVAKALDHHYLEKGRYPVFKSWDELVADSSPLREYLNDLPKADGFNKPYEIEVSSETDFKIIGYGLKGEMEDYPDFHALPGPKIEYKKNQ